MMDQADTGMLWACSESPDTVGLMMVCRCSQPLGAILCRNEGGLQPLNDVFMLDTEKLRWLYPKLAGGTGPSSRFKLCVVPTSFY